MTTLAREASLRPFGKPSPRWWMAIIALSVMVLSGIAAWIVQLKLGMGVAGYNDHAFWAIYIADAITFIGVSYGGAVVSAILRLTGADWRAPLTRLAEGTAIVTVLIGAALIIPHLGNPILMWELIVRPNLAAPVFWDLVAVMTYTFASIVFFTLPLVPDMAALHKGHATQLGKRRARLYASVSKGWIGAPRQRRVLAGALGLVSILIIPLAVSVHSNLAWIFATTSRPWWHESIWAPQFVVAALYSGVALVILVVAGFRRGYHLEGLITERHFVRLSYIMVTFTAAYLYFTFADLLPGAYVGEHSVALVFEQLLTGELALWFWTFAVGAGLLPLLIIAIPKTRNIKGIVFASMLIVPMMWLKRMLMVTAPASYDTITGAFGEYHFTWVPIVITLAATAAIPLLLMLLFRVVPLLSIDEIEEIEEIHEMEQMAALEKALAARAHAESNDPGGHDQKVGATGRGAHRAAGATGVLLFVALLGLVGVGTAAPADAATPPAVPGVTLVGTEASGAVQLTATVISPAGQPQDKTKVAFQLLTKQFGAQGRLVPLGSETTDQTGVARLTYKPTVTGVQEFFVSTTATAGAKALGSGAIVTVTVAKSAYTPPADKPLAGVGKVLVVVLFTIVAGVWLTLGAQVVRVRRVCREGQNPAASSA